MSTVQCECGITIEMSAQQNEIKIEMADPNIIPVIYESVPPAYEYSKYYEEIVNARDTVVNMVAHKQDKLTAGTNISIIDNVISAIVPEGVPASVLAQIETNKQTIAQQQREINALIKMQGGQIYDYELAQGTEHSVDVPNGVKLCDVLEINGRSVVVNQLYDSVGVIENATTNVIVSRAKIYLIFLKPI